MLNCISTLPGAIGFVDADKALLANMYGPIKFNGAAASATAIQNGLYDRFWTLEHVFEPSPQPGGYPTGAVANMMTYSVSHVPSGKAGFWVNANATGFHKLTDWDYPPQVGPYVTGTCYE